MEEFSTEPENVFNEHEKVSTEREIEIEDFDDFFCDQVVGKCSFSEFRERARIK